jgi:hypothetical protein
MKVLTYIVAKFLQLAPEKGASCEYLLSGGGGSNV